VALQDLQGAAKNGATELDDLKASIEGFGSAQLDVNSSTRQFEAAVDDLTASVTENGTSLDVGTEKGRANQAALDSIASSALGLASATLTQTGSQDAATRSLEGGRAKLIEALGAFGITGQAAESYADQLGLIPSNISTAVAVTGAQTAEAIIAQVARDRTANILIRAQDTTPQSGGTTRPGFADGGAITGPGGPTEDSILIRASAGEHMLDARDVQLMGGHGNVYALRAALNGGQLTMDEMLNKMQGYRNGGAIRGSDSDVWGRTQYMTPQIVQVQGRSSGGAGATQVDVNVAPMVSEDPTVTATVIGREISRRLAGVVL
jgi:hypothetical protein